MSLITPILTCLLRLRAAAGQGGGKRRQLIRVLIYIPPSSS
jgi:hypothetical protein